MTEAMARRKLAVAVATMVVAAAVAGFGLAELLCGTF
jgi:hypothetical protein